MFRNLRRFAAFAFALLALTAVLAACSTSGTEATTPAPAQGMGMGQGQGQGHGHGQGQPGGMAAGSETMMPAGGHGPLEGDEHGMMMDVNALPGGELSDEERASLLFMREEEKLAHDVYIALYEKWQLPIFEHIANSETQHTNMVLALIEKYNLDDPAAGKAPGEFTNPDLQALYDKLVAQGSQSLADALKVGGAIEEIDILDLQERIAQTDNEDIRTIYNNLMMGSENHLRAFTRTLAQETGETYQPQYMDKDAYDAIVSAPMGHGGDHGEGGCAGEGAGFDHDHDDHDDDH